MNIFGKSYVGYIAIIVIYKKHVCLTNHRETVIHMAQLDCKSTELKEGGMRAGPGTSQWRLFITKEGYWNERERQDCLWICVTISLTFWIFIVQLWLELRRGVGGHWSQCYLNLFYNMQLSEDTAIAIEQRLVYICLKTPELLFTI